MSTDHQDFHPPTSTTTAADLQRQHSSSTTGNNLHSFTTLLLPQKSSPMTPTNAVEPNSTPESLLAAALGHAIMNIPSTSFQDAAAAAAVTTNPLLRTLSDANSSHNQDLPTTTNPLIRTLSDANSSLTQDLQTTTTTPHKVPRNNPHRRTFSNQSDYQQPLKTRTPPPRVSLSPTGKQSPQSERLRKMLREIEQRCLEIMSEGHVDDEANPNPNPNPTLPQDEQEECVGVERQENGDLRFELGCSCGKRFEMVLKHNGYCFYRLT